MTIGATAVAAVLTGARAAFSGTTAELIINGRTVAGTAGIGRGAGAIEGAGYMDANSVTFYCATEDIGEISHGNFGTLNGKIVEVGTFATYGPLTEVECIYRPAATGGRVT